MTTFATALRSEIERVSRKEVRTETLALKKTSAQYRKDIAALKRRLAQTEALVKRLLKVAGSKPGKATANEDIAAEQSPKTRYSAKSLISQRTRLGLTHAQIGQLVGASGQSVYKWEEQKAVPQKRYLPAIAALRQLNKKVAADHLASLTK